MSLRTSTFGVAEARDSRNDTMTLHSFGLKITADHCPKLPTKEGRSLSFCSADRQGSSFE